MSCVILQRRVPLRSLYEEAGLLTPPAVKLSINGSDGGEVARNASCETESDPRLVLYSGLRNKPMGTRYSYRGLKGRADSSTKVLERKERGTFQPGIAEPGLGNERLLLRLSATV